MLGRVTWCWLGGRLLSCLMLACSACIKALQCLCNASMIARHGGSDRPLSRTLCTGNSSVRDCSTSNDNDQRSVVIIACDWTLNHYHHWWVLLIKHIDSRAGRLCQYPVVPRWVSDENPTQSRACMWCAQCTAHDS